MAKHAIPSARHRRSAAALAAAAALTGALLVDAAVAVAGVDPRNQVTSDRVDSHSAVIDNGVVRLGIHDEGHLNLYADTDGDEVLDDTVGLQLLRGAERRLEATSPGCTCEGWGAGDAYSGVSGSANDADGIENVHFREGDFTAGVNSAGDGIARSRVTIRGAVGTGPTPTPTSDSGTATIAPEPVEGDVLEVVHDFHPSSSPNLYEVTVTITNLSDSVVAPRYRRVMDWDVEPTPFEEYVTIGGSESPYLLFSSNDGFGTADPLGRRSDLGRLGPGTEPLEDPEEEAARGFFEDAGPDDHGALFDFGFPDLPPGAGVSFNIYYGAAPSEVQALAALDFVGATLYSLGQSSGGAGTESPEDDSQLTGEPATFMFGFGGIGSAVAARPSVRIRPDALRSEPGGRNGYTVQVQNPTSSVVRVATVTTTVPAGFTYVPGSATLDGDALKAEPAISEDGRTLTWSPPSGDTALALVRPRGARRLHFAVDVSDVAGTYYSVATATALSGVIRGSGPGAPITVLPPDVTPSAPTASAGTGSITTGADGITVSMANDSRSDLTLGTAVACPDGAGALTGATLEHNGAAYPMTQLADGTWTATVPAAALGNGPLVVVAECATPIRNAVGTVALYDPSGIVSDAVTGAPITGATVTLRKRPFEVPDVDATEAGARDCRTVDTRGGSDWSRVPPADEEGSEPGDPLVTPAEMSPLVNPQVTGADGRYGWDVAAGCWYVVVEAPGYERVVSALVGVPPAVTDLHIAMTPIPVATPTPSATATAVPTPTPSATATAAPTSTPVALDPVPPPFIGPLFPPPPAPAGAGTPSASTTPAQGSSSPEPGQVTPTATTTSGAPPPAADCDVTATLARRVITVGETADLTVGGVAPGSTVRVHAYTRPSTTYREVRSFTSATGEGRTFILRPPGSTRLYVSVDGCPTDAVRSHLLLVRSSVSMSALQTGPRDVIFLGRVLPARPGQAVSVFRLAGDTSVLTSRATVGRSGTWRVSRSFLGTGTFEFVARSASDLDNVGGQSVRRSATLS